MRVVFIGANWKFSLVHLEHLLANHEVVGIVNSVPNAATIPAMSFKRKLKLKAYSFLAKLIHKHEELPLQEIARKKGIPFIQYNKSQKDRLKALLTELKADIIVVASMSQLLPSKFLSLTKYGAINVHGSYLPGYKSKNPFFWQLLNADYQSGVTVHYIDAGVDSGNILAQTRFDLNYGISSNELVDTLSNHAVSLLPKALEKVLNREKGQPQAKSTTSTYFKPHEAEKDYVKWNEWSIERTWHFLFAVQRWYIPPQAKNKFGKLTRIGSFIKKDMSELEEGKAGSCEKIGQDHFLIHPEGLIKVYLGEK